MFLSKKYLRMSLKSIGEYFGGRDHTTVLHSRQTMSDLIETDTHIAALVDEVELKMLMTMKINLDNSCTN